MDQLYDTIYRRTYLNRLRDHHPGNLFRYYNFKTGDVKSLRIDIEFATINETKFVCLKHNYSKQVLLRLKRTDTVAALKDRIFRQLGYEAGKQVLRSEKSGKEVEDSVQLRAYNDTYFRLTFPRVKRGIRVHVVLANEPSEDVYSVEEVVDKSLSKNFKRFLRLYKSLFYHLN